MPAKKTKNNIIDNVPSPVFIKHFFVVYNDIKNEMKNFESFMDWWTRSRSVTDKPRYNSWFRAGCTSSARNLGNLPPQYSTVLQKWSFFISLPLFICILKIRYLGNKGARARILLGFFIPHWGLSIAKRWDLNGLNTWGSSLVSNRILEFCLGWIQPLLVRATQNYPRICLLKCWIEGECSMVCMYSIQNYYVLVNKVWKVIKSFIFYVTFLWIKQ